MSQSTFATKTIIYPFFFRVPSLTVRHANIWQFDWYGTVDPARDTCASEATDVGPDRFVIAVGGHLSQRPAIWKTVLLWPKDDSSIKYNVFKAEAMWQARPRQLP